MSNKLINLFWENYRVEKSLLRFFINVDERLRINKIVEKEVKNMEDNRTQLILCPNCGEEISEGVSYCPHCGVSLSWEDE